MRCKSQPSNIFKWRNFSFADVIFLVKIYAYMGTNPIDWSTLEFLAIRSSHSNGPLLNNFCSDIFPNTQSWPWNTSTLNYYPVEASDPLPISTSVAESASLKIYTIEYGPYQQIFTRDNNKLLFAGVLGTSNVYSIYSQTEVDIRVRDTMGLYSNVATIAVDQTLSAWQPGGKRGGGGGALVPPINSKA